ncbi:MAG: chemotaxis protein CheW [Nitrospirota bacterium]
MEGLALPTDDGAQVEAGRATLPVCTFGQGRPRLAVPLAALRAVLDPCLIFALPTAPEWILGVVHWRGEVVPLLDGEYLFASETTAVSEVSRFLVFENGGVPVAVRTAGVPTLAALVDGDNVVEEGMELPPHVRGVWSYHGEPHYLLDIEGLLAAHRP